MVLRRRLEGRWLQILTHLAALLPLARLGWDYGQNLFLVDPVREITTRTGKTALILLLLSLACTPIGTLLGLQEVRRVRRTLGIYAFIYASLHALTFVGLDYGFDLALIRDAIFDQRYVLAGSAAFALLLPLAITSTRGWQKRLGKHWKRLHRLAYPAGVLAVVHFVWLVKDIREPLRYAALLALLLVVRIPAVRRVVSHTRRRFRAQISRTRSSN